MDFIYVLDYLYSVYTSILDNLAVYNGYDYAARMSVFCTYMFIIAFAVYLILYGFMAVGLARMAKKQGYNKVWLAYVPFAQTYLIGKLAGEVNLFGKKFRKFGLFAMITEIVSFIPSIVYYIIESFICINGYRSYNVIQNQSYESYITYSIQSVNYLPDNLTWLNSLSNLTSLLSFIFSIILILVMVDLLIALFKKYNPKSFLPMAILGVIFPISSFMIFAVRNANPVDYAAYQKAKYYQRQQQYNKMYGSNMNNQNNQWNPYNNPYGAPNFNPYNNQGQNNKGPQDPFSEFSDNKKNDFNPFGDFNTEKKYQNYGQDTVKKEEPVSQVKNESPEVEVINKEPETEAKKEELKTEENKTENSPKYKSSYEETRRKFLEGIDDKEEDKDKNKDKKDGNDDLFN